MKKNKLLTIMLIILVTLTLLGVVAVILLTQLNKDPKEPEAPPIEDVVASSVVIPELTTNLADGGYAKVALQIETDSEDAAAELTLRIFQVNDIIIQELSEMEEAELQGKQGKILFTKAVKAQVNELMQEGEVVEIYITSFIIQ